MRLWPFAVASSFLIGIVAWSTKGPREPLEPRYISELTECPHDWTPLRHPKTDSLVFGEGGTGAISDALTDVPEYHDCQRLIENNVYGPLVAVFVSDSSASIQEKLGLKMVSVDSQMPVDEIGARDNLDTDEGIAAVQIVNTGLDGTLGYAPMHIDPGVAVSCVYLYSDGRGWNAWLFKVKYPGTKCPRRLRRGAATERMVVSAYRVGSFAHEDYPPVARWEWDGKTNHIGTKCGQAWCQIAFAPQEYDNGSLPRGNVSRVYRIKGWYDQQRLLAPGPGTGPMEITSTVIPDDKLDSYTTVNVFRNHWLHAADVYIDSDRYRAKANFTRATFGSTPNRIYFRMLRITKSYAQRLRYPYAAKCSKAAVPPKAVGSDTTIWEAMVWPASGGDCVTYHVKRCPGLTEPMHVGDRRIRVIGTARWRWMKDDETIWAECAQGCCQLEVVGAN